MESFVLYTSYKEILEDLTNEEMGYIFRAILEYKANGVIIDLPNNLKMTFKFIKLELDKQKQEKQAKSEAGKRGNQIRWSKNSSAIASESQPIASESQPIASESQPIASDNSAISAINTSVNREKEEKKEIPLKENKESFPLTIPYKEIKENQPLERKEERESVCTPQNQTQNQMQNSKRFVKPTKEEIEQFCKEEQLCIDVYRFLNHYESNGWKVGRNPMKSWKATVRNWARDGTYSKQSVADEFLALGRKLE